MKIETSLMIVAIKPDGKEIRFNVDIELKSQAEYELWKAGGILRKFKKMNIDPV